LEDLGADEDIILEWILGKYCGNCSLDSSGSGEGPVARFYEHGDEPSDSIKGGEFLDYPSDCAPWS
jgi:hypothetical protein